jgi:hypothetical protein
MRRERKKERGVALTAVVIMSAALFAAAAVGVDTGRLALVANEVQAVADIAATAGAKALLDGGTASTARNHAQTVVAQNFVDGAAATIDPATQIEVGQFDPQTGTFTPNALPPSAVRATPSATVQNLFVGIFGSSYENSTVTKTATAGFTGLGKAAPTLPLVIRDCELQELQNCFGDDSCLPELKVQSTTEQNSCWSSLTVPQTNPGNVGQYFPEGCFDPGDNQAPKTFATPPVIGIDTPLNLSQGTIDGAVEWVRKCVDHNKTTFLVPIVSCSTNCNQSAPVTGFATVKVTGVTDHDFTLKFLTKDTSGMPGGGGAYGTGKMRLYN